MNHRPKYKSIKSLEEIIENLCDIEAGRDFLECNSINYIK